MEEAGSVLSLVRRVFNFLPLALTCRRFLDALHLALCAHFVYYYLVVNYDDPSALLHMVWSFKVRHPSPACDVI